MAGYNPKDTEERRITKACYFYKSMLRKGQSRDDALGIASRYYHVSETSLKSALSIEELDDDIYFLINGSIPVSASEIFDPGDFC